MLKPLTLQVVLPIAVSYRWVTKQLDVSNDFLHGDLHDFIFIEQPPRFVDIEK